MYIVSIGFSAHAEQKLFKRQYAGADVVLSYRWQDRSRKNRTLVFRLSKKDVAKGNSEFKGFDNQKANDYAFKKVQEFVKKFPRLRVEENSYGFDVIYINMSSSEQAVYAKKIKAAQEQAMEEYTKQNFYMRYGDYVMPDHRHIAKRYVTPMEPVVRAIRSKTRGYNQRATINYMLGWLQTIPYDQLVNRETSNGAGFQTPYGLLLNNRGDCDTKSVTLAAMLRQLYPHLRSVIVYVPEHAFVGIQMRPQKGDYSIRLGGENFILLDPTGPGLSLLGEVEEKSEKYLKAGKYSYQEVPF
ncbi:MAG: hypothetical protein OXQ96_06525 [Alphaproteobacteria bacterium]|nr:hypothetical protein [Alphaproteobacteria bacterium]